jgi:zinc D-Ala-D-Ala carboxypeptidase
MQLSEHFSLDELTHSDLAVRKGISNDPTPDVISNLTRLAGLLEQVRKYLNKPILINSGYRCPELNQAVGGQKSSQHLLGCAADIRISGMTPDEIVKAIIQTDIQFDQMIREFDSWVHISVTNKTEDTPRNQVLIIDKLGTRPYK